MLSVLGFDIWTRMQGTQHDLTTAMVGSPAFAAEDFMIFHKKTSATSGEVDA